MDAGIIVSAGRAQDVYLCAAEESDYVTGINNYYERYG